MLLGLRYPKFIKGFKVFLKPLFYVKILCEVCSQSYLYAPFNSKIEAINFVKYLKTKFFRSLVLAIKITQSASNKVYKFVPMQDYINDSDIDWSRDISEIDKQLYLKYGLSEDEINYIESMIKPME